MGESSDTCKKLKEVYSEILKDNLFMCEKTIVKSKILLNKLENVNSSEVKDLNIEMKKLLERMTTNIMDFTERYDCTVNEYENSLEVNKSKLPNSPKRKLNLSLRKNGTTQETDVDLTNSEAEDADTIKDTKNAPKETKHHIKIDISESESDDLDSTIKKIEKIVGGNKSPVREKPVEPPEANDGDVSSDDSQKTIPLNNFDVQIPIEGVEGSKAELNSTLTSFIIEDSQKVKEEDITDFEAASFDFDDEDLSTKLEKKELAEEDSRIVEESHQNNHELLQLLNEATDNPDYVATEQEGDEALQILEDEISLPTNEDSDDSILSEIDLDNEHSNDSWEPKFPESPIGSDNVEVAMDVENCKNVTLSLERIDDLNDAAIDRLCDLHSLNKRKCVKILRPRRRRLKRARIRSTTSSTSTSSRSSSSSSSGGSTTPDIPLEDVQDLAPSPGANMEALADECVHKLDSDNDIRSSDSETDIEKEVEVKEKKKKKTKPLTSGDDDDKDEEAPVEIKTKKPTSDWRLDPLLREKNLWSSSESETEKEKPEPKPTLPDPPVIIPETTVISDSLSESDDDVTFVQEGDLDDTPGKGRRNIRAIIDDDELNEMTQRAKNEEEQRIHRLEEHSKTIESIQSQHDDFVLDVDVNTGTALVTVDRNLAHKMKPHQRTGLQFIWEACYESVAMLKTNAGTGCILAHCMGLGKTLQVIALIHTLFTHEVTKTKYVVVVCPLSTVSNWKNEFRMAFKEASVRANIKLHFLIKQDMEEKCRIVTNWRSEGGVIVMGYEAFQHLTREKDGPKSKNKIPPEMKKKIQEALIDPGPDLIVCDEGHLLKNGDTLRTKSLMKVKTKRRIVLTGTPLQNNLIEYYFMVQFVKPHLLGTFSEYKNRFAHPIMNGQYDNSLPEDIKVMKKRTHVLTKLLKKTIHRIESKVLESYLPEIEDYTICIKLQPVQMKLYKKYIELVRSTVTKSTGFFQDFRITKYISLHPYTLHKYYAEFKNKNRKKKLKEIVTQDEEIDDNANLRVKEDWYEDLYPTDANSNVNYSLKMKLILAIINETVRNGEKILIFAHQLPELESVSYFLEKCGTSDFPSWKLNRNFYKMDGEVSPEFRSQLCDNFNNDPSVKVFLISHGVGGLGLNLTAANRVILIASNHNPSHDTQSIYRVYRFGQTKKCYVYRLLSLGIMEEKIYRRCVVKLAVAGTVVDKFHFDRHYKATDLQQMYEYDFESHEERPIPLVPNDKLLATLLQSSQDIFTYHEHKALLENRPDEELTDEDKKLAWDEFKKEEEREEAVKNVAVALPPQPLPYRPPIVPINVLYPYNQFGQQADPRNNAPNVVFNPLSVRTQFPRGLQANHAQARVNLRPNLPSTSTIQRLPNGASLPQASTSAQRPQLNGARRGVNMQYNPFLKLLEYDHLRQKMNSQKNGDVTQKEVMDRVQSVIRANPVAQRLHNMARQTTTPAVIDLVDEAPVTGEFNYALNKMQ